MNVSICELESDDRAGIEALYEKSIRANPEGFIQYLSFHGNIVDLLTRFTMQGGSAAVMKNDQGQVIGFGGLKPIDKTSAELCKLHLDAAYQGKGLGKQLSVNLISKARAQGFSQVDLHVTVTQKAAIGLYEKLGFTTWQRQNCPVQLGGEVLFFDTLYMRIAL